MADQWNSNIPALSNQVAADVPDIKENLEHAKDTFERIVQAWSTSAGGNASAKFNSAAGFSDGTYNYEFPTNGVAASSVIMLGNSSTVVWMYLNAAPPGWKVLTTGQGTVLAVSDITGLLASGGGTATSGTSGTTLKDGAADYVTDTIVAGDVIYNTTDSTVTTVASVSDLNTIVTTDAIMATGETYRIGKAYVEAGGRQTSYGTWTQPNHTLTTDEIPEHTHTLTAKSAGAASGTHVITTNSTDTTVTSAVNTTTESGHNHGTVWRPVASIGKLYQLNTA